MKYVALGKKINASFSRKGFTLLELLLVIALISILVASGFTTYQIQVKNFKIDKTALQMQQWLQAGMAFYADCGQWPDPTKDPNVMQEMMGVMQLTPKACPRLRSPIVRAYIPLYANTNGPWPNNYTIGVGTGSYTGLFQVTTYLPAFQNQPFFWWVTPYNIARAIAGRLPNAQAEIDTTREPRQAYVTASVGVPGSVNNSGGPVSILNMQLVTLKPNVAGKSTIKVPLQNDCPLGTVPKIFAALAGVQAGYDEGKSSTRRGLYQATIDTSYHDSRGFILPKMPIVSSCAPYGKNCGESQDSDREQTLLITACVPSESNGANTQNNTISLMVRY